MKASGKTMLVSFLLITMFCGTAFCDSATITGVQISPDLRQVAIKFDGMAGKHSAFVIENPYRLVLDFEATGLAKVANKINVGRDPIDSIRLGQGNGRTRLVVDFGNNPVPPFRIDRQASAVIINLASGGTPSHRPAPLARPAPLPPDAMARPLPVAKKPAVATRAAAPKAKDPETQPTAKRSAGMAVKSAGMAENFVFVEIADQKNPKNTYRLVIDMDREELNVRGATLSDPRGNVKRFQVTSQGGPVKGSPEPEKQELKADNSESTNDSKGKFKWGLQSSETGAEFDSAEKAGPFRMERFELKPKPNPQAKLDLTE